MTDRKTRMTAEQRRAYRMAQKEKQRWQAEKHRRILHVLHRAQELGFQTLLDTHPESLDDIRIRIEDDDEELFVRRRFFVGTISEWTMSQIENDLKVVEDQRNEQLTRRRKLKEVLARLTKEERDLLGI